MSDGGVRQDRNFGVVMTGFLALGVALLALAYALFAGSGDAAKAFAGALQQGKQEEAASLCEPAVQPRLATLSWLRGSADSVEVERGTAGLWHDGFIELASAFLERGVGNPSVQGGEETPLGLGQAVSPLSHGSACLCDPLS